MNRKREREYENVVPRGQTENDFNSNVFLRTLRLFVFFFFFLNNILQRYNAYKCIQFSLYSPGNGEKNNITEIKHDYLIFIVLSRTHTRVYHVTRALCVFRQFGGQYI